MTESPGMNVAMIGTGYVGLVSGACLADLGHNVTCIDKNPRIVERLNRGEMPIYEPGLDQVVARNVDAGRLSFTAVLDGAIPQAEAVFLAVGTPPRPQDGRADLSYVFAAAREVAPLLAGRTVIATKSTVPVGTGREIRRIIGETAPGADVDVASVPEFLREGTAVRDYFRPDRIIIGADTPYAAELLKKLHVALLEGDESRFVVTGVETAELIKYGSNAFLALKVTFINELANLCEKIGANIEDVARGMGLDRRIGRWGLSAGPGYGGSCFPKDTQALAFTAADAGAPIRTVETAIEVNAIRKEALASRVASALGGTLMGKTVAVLGLTFKADTDDTRDSPSTVLVNGLTSAGARVRVFDPQGMDQAKSLLNGVAWCTDAIDAARGADAAAIVTEWPDFGPDRLDLAQLRAALASPIVIDFRNLHDPAIMARQGFTYHSMGRPTAPARS